MSDVTADAVAAIADLADAMTGIRVLFEQEAERVGQERAEEADEKARREPVRREAALRELRDFLNGEILGHVPDGFEASERGELVERLAAAFDERLRSSWGLRDAFRTLSAAHPPQPLTDVARRKAEAQLGTAAGDVEIERWMNTWLAGALYHERG